MKYLKKFNESSKRFTLDKSSKDEISNIVDDLFSYCQENKNKRKIRLYKSINLKTLDGSPFTLPIYIDRNFEGGQAGIGFVDPDLQPTRHALGNLHLIVNPKYVFSKKSLYNTLYHEILHAVDPTITSKHSPKYLSKYGDSVEEPEKYFSHGIELRGITGEFFEALVQEFKERADSCKDIGDVEALEDALNSIVVFFNEMQMFDPLAHDILHSMDGIINGTSKDLDTEPDCLVNIDLIRSSSPEGWKMFLKMLYATSEEIKGFLTEKVESFEEEITESYKSREEDQTQLLSDEEFLEILNKNCKNFSFSNDQLYRACGSKHPLALFVEKQRIGLGSGKIWYGQYPGYADFFKKISTDRENYPVLRTHSLIGSMHGVGFAKGLMGFGERYLVIPFDGTKIVLTPYPDLGMAVKSLGKKNVVDESDFIMVEYTKDFKFPEEEIDKINPKVRSHAKMKSINIEKEGEFFTNGPCLLVRDNKIEWLKSVI